MTALSDFRDFQAPNMPARTVDGARWLARGFAQFVGVVLVLVAFGLWLLPNTQWEADLTLMKLGISLFVGFAGLALLDAGRAQRMVEVQIDTTKGEVRLVRSAKRQPSAQEVISRARFEDLGPAEHRGEMVHLWAGDGGLVAEVALSDPGTRTELLNALRAAGKL